MGGHHPRCPASRPTPSRETIRCYASALGHSKDPQRAAESARRLTGQGFRAVQKIVRQRELSFD